MNFEEIGRILDREVKPKTRQDLAALLRKPSRRLEKVAAKIEKEQRSRNGEG